MKIVAAILVAVLMCGCRENKKTDDTPIRQDQPINGAFGFTLGERIDASIQTHPIGAHRGKMAVIQTTKFPPFSSIRVFALDDGRIYAISGQCAGGVWKDDDKRAAISELRSKYGPPIHGTSPGVVELWWGNTAISRAIILNDDGINYYDNILNPAILNPEPRPKL